MDDVIAKQKLEDSIPDLERILLRIHASDMPKELKDFVAQQMSVMIMVTKSHIRLHERLENQV